MDARLRKPMLAKAATIQSKKRDIAMSLGTHPPGVIRQRCHTTYSTVMRKKINMVRKPALIIYIHLLFKGKENLPDRQTIRYHLEE